MSSDDLKTLRQFVACGLVGLSGVGVGLGMINLVMRLHPNFVLANVAAFFVAVTWNFLLNRRFTFRNANDKPIGVQWMLFVVSSLFGTAVNWAVSFTLYFRFAFFEQYYNLPALCGVAVGYTVNFILAKLIVFNRSSESIGRDRE